MCLFIKAISETRIKYLFLILILCYTVAVPQNVLQQHRGGMQEEQDYVVATGLFRDSLFAFAQMEFEQFIKRYPTSHRIPEIAFLKVECLYFQGQYEKALVDYEHYIRNYPKNTYTPKALFRKGETLLRLKRYNAAVETFKSILEKYPESEYIGETAYWIGESYFASRDYNNALKYYQFSYEQRYKNRVLDYTLYSIGWTYQTLAQYSQAISWYDSVIVLTPSSILVGKACIQKAECFALQKKYSDALNGLIQCREVVARAEDKEVLDFYIAEYFYQTEKYTDAQKHYEQFLSNYPNSRRIALAEYGRAWSLLKQNYLTEAANQFKSIADEKGELSSASL